MDPDQTPRVKYDDVMSDDEPLRIWLTHIVSPSVLTSGSNLLTLMKWDKGFCFVDDVPVNPEATQSLIERIAFIRNTHYGMHSRSTIH